MLAKHRQELYKPGEKRKFAPMIKKRNEDEYVCSLFAQSKQAGAFVYPGFSNHLPIFKSFAYFQITCLSSNHLPIFRTLARYISRHAPPTDTSMLTILKLNPPPKLPKPKSEAIKPPTNEPIIPRTMLHASELPLPMSQLANQPTNAPNSSQSNKVITINKPSLSCKIQKTIIQITPQARFSLFIPLSI